MAKFFLGFIVLLGLANTAMADDAYLREFSRANGHLRIAVSYLRTGNIDFAALELLDSRVIWSRVADLKGAENLSNIGSKTLLAVDQSLNNIDSGDTKSARRQLLAARQDIYLAHVAAGLSPFEDCIWKTIKTGAPIWPFIRNEQKLDNQAENDRMVTAVDAYRLSLATCNRNAPAAISSNPEFRRLADSALASLVKLRDRVVSRNYGLVFRYLIELRSTDRLLYLKFG